ncbi:MAG: arginine N-succinyltransferase [Alphaproteobacteria bacterium]
MSHSFLIRPIQMSDAQDLLDLVKTSAGGLSSLQPRLDFLKDYIASAEKSFAGTKPVDVPHKYLMGMVEIETGRLVGCAAVKTCVGVEAPFINFDLKGDGLDQHLEASSRFLGATEVGSLFLHEDYRADGLGRYLAKARYHLMEAEPWRFGDTVIAELRGICGVDGSPLYDFLFKDKLEKTFLEADMEYYDRNPDALGSIVPLGQIPTAKLPKDVRASIAQPHPSGRAAMRLLQGEGFIFSGTIDLFDAGPIMSVYRDTIRTNMETQKAAIYADENTGSHDFMLMSTGTVADFRAVVTRGYTKDGTIHASSTAVKALRCQSGESVNVWKTPARARKKPRLSLVKSHA